MSPGSRQSGFTLIEVLVVLVLIGIILGMAVLAFSGAGPRERLEEEARRLQQLVTLAREEAILQVQDLALEVERGGYRFARLEAVAAKPSGDGVGAQPMPGLEWRPLTGDPLLRPRELQAGHEIRLFSDTPGVAGTEEDDSEEADRPRIHLAPSGEMTPFELRLTDPAAGVEVRLIGEPDGRLRIAEAEERT